MTTINIKYFCRLIILLFPLIFLCSIKTFCQKKYTIQYLQVGKDSSIKIEKLGLKSIFDDEEAAATYLGSINNILLGKGFPAASVDSVKFDSSSAAAQLYLGEQFKWAEINTDSVDTKVLDATGWNTKKANVKMDFSRLQVQQEKIINYYEDNGYPFAEVYLENIEFSGDKIKGSMAVNRGPLYHVDSIRVYGNAKIKNGFLQHYLEVSNGSVYNNTKFKDVSKRIQELPYLQEQQPWDITILGILG